MHKLQQHPLRRLLVVEAASWFGTYSTPVVLAFAVLDRGGGATRVGVVLAADTLGMLISIPYGGTVADRFSRSRVMCAAEAAAAALQAAAVLVLLAGVGTVALLAFLQGLVGLSRGFFNPAATGLVPSLIADDEQRRTVNGLLGATQASARLAAPALAGFVVAVASPAIALLANCAAYALSAVVLATFPATGTCHERESAIAAMRRGWRELRRREWLWLTVLWFGGLQCVAQAPLLVLGPELAHRSLHGPIGWGAVLGALGIGAASGAALTAVLRPRRPLRPAVAAYALWAVPLLALASGSSLELVAAAAAVAGCASGFFSATWFTVFQRNVPREAISRISAWDWEISLAGLPLGMLVAPVVAHAFGTPATLACAAILAVLATFAVARRPSLGRVAG